MIVVKLCIITFLSFIFSIVFYKDEFEAYKKNEEIRIDEYHGDYNLFVSSFDKHGKYTRVYLKRKDEIVCMNVYSNYKFDCFRHGFTKNIEWYEDKVVIESEHLDYCIYFDGNIVEQIKE